MNVFLLATEFDSVGTAVASLFAASDDLPDLQRVEPAKAGTTGITEHDVLIIGESAVEPGLGSGFENATPGLVQFLGCRPSLASVDHWIQSGALVAGVSPIVAPRVANRVAGFGGPLGVRNKDGATVWGIIGFGFTGIEVARKLKSSGAEVITADIRTPRAGILNELGIRRYSLDLLMAGSDAITLHVFPGPTANPLVRERELRLMKQGAVLINTSHNSVVDESAVVSALLAGTLGGYATDCPGGVVEGADEELKSVGKLLVTTNPLTNQIGAVQHIARFVIRNVEAFSGGSKVDGQIDPIDFPKTGDPSFWSSRMTDSDERVRYFATRRVGAVVAILSTRTAQALNSGVSVMKS